MQNTSISMHINSIAAGMKLDIDVNVINPVINTAKSQYEQLPEPVRQVMPFAGKAAFVESLHKDNTLTDHYVLLIIVS